MASNSGRPAKAPRYTLDLLKTPGMAFEVSVPDPTKRIQTYIDAYRLSEPDKFQGFDEDFMRNHIQVISASLTNNGSGAQAIFAMRNASVFSNRMGNMHGGAVAMIFDMCTTMCAAPLAKPGFWVFGGVSRSLSITFLRPVRPDMDMIIECEVLQQGQRLATIRGVMRDKSNNAVLAVAEHNKVSIQFETPKSENGQVPKDSKL